MNTIKNKGFTIIELMIAVAIIGILAAIAVPAYQSYTVRAKVSEALGFADSAKTAVAEYYQSNGSFPNGMDNSTVGLPGANSMSGTNTQSVTVARTDANTATIAVLTSIAGITNFNLTFTGTATSGGMNWVCSVPAASGQYAPSSCTRQ